MIRLWLLATLLAWRSNICIAWERGIAFTEPAGDQVGSSVVQVPTGVRGKAKCGVSSKFWGIDRMETFQARVVSDLGKETFCTTNWTGVVVLWPNLIWDQKYVRDPEQTKRDYPCINFEDQPFFLDFFDSKGVSGIVYALDYKNLPDALGLLWTDDFGFSRTKYKDLKLHVFECAFPQDWEAPLLSNHAVVQFEMEATLAMRDMLESTYYLLIFRVFFPFLYASVAVQGLKSIFQTCRRHEKKTRALSIAILAVNVYTSLALFCVLVVEGWWATGIYSSLLRDSFAAGFIAPSLGSALFFGIQWGEFTSSWMKGQVAISASDILRRHRQKVIVVGVILVIHEFTVYALVLKRVVRIAVLRDGLVSFYVLLEACISAYFFLQSRKFTRLVKEMARHDEKGSYLRELMLRSTRLIACAGYALFYFVIATSLLTWDAVLASPQGWVLIWGNFHVARVFVSASLISVACVNRKQVNKVTSSPQTASK